MRVPGPAMPVRELLLLVVALVALVAAGGKSALLLAAGSSVVGWEPWRDQKKGGRAERLSNSGLERR